MARMNLYRSTDTLFNGTTVQSSNANFVRAPRFRHSELRRSTNDAREQGLFIIRGFIQFLGTLLNDLKFSLIFSVEGISQ